MTVAELIAELQRHPQERLVVVERYSDYTEDVEVVGVWGVPKSDHVERVYPTVRTTMRPEDRRRCREYVAIA